MPDSSELLIPNTSEQTVLITEQSEEKPPIADLIQRYLNGESTEVLGRECKTSRRTLYNWMHSELTDKHYPDLVKTAIVNRIADADEKLANAQDSLQVARAREEAKFARWDAERRLKLFRSNQEAVDNRVMVVIER